MAVPGNTLVEIFQNRVAKTPDLPALRAKIDGQWKVTTFRDYGQQAREVANGLLSLGVQKGENVALLSNDRPEWLITDAGILLTGAASVPVYVTNSPSQVAYVVGHSDSKVAFVENQDQLDKVLKTKNEIPKLEKVVVFTGEGADENDFVISFEQLKRMGRDYEKANSGELDQRISSVKPEDLATIVYTSGTTGPPKGAMLSHGNFAWTLQAVTQPLPFNDGTDRALCYLPLSHIFERLTSGWGCAYNGIDIWFAESIEKLKDNLTECRPTFFIGVPRVYEKFYLGLKQVIAAHPKKNIIEKAIHAGMEKVEHEQAGKSLPIGLKLKFALLDKLALSKLRHGLGMDHLRFAVTGAAPINPEIIKFMHAIGIDLLEGYGQTEDNAPTSVNPKGKARIGTVGPPLPGEEVKFDEDGEILVRGPNVFMGYWKDEKATRETMTEDGFLRTGDVGEFDEAGYLKITDRKKDLIITAGGKNIAPQEIEGRLKFAPLVSQAVVIGDRRPFLTALLTLDPEVAPKWAKDQGIEFNDVTELAEEPKVLEALQGIVDSVNQNLAQVEQIKKWTVLPRDFTQEAEEITPTMKVKRKTINEKYGSIIEKLYAK
ncbi:MAG TPA: long-chain fatty acid--CoA ligase [Actinomycetota bacterium]|nr:long-chain fatty acid--CoA ligase [Actinomycetota bacterium]